MKARLLGIFLLLLPLCVALLGAGCKKDKEIGYNSTGIVGKWQLLQYPETCVGYRDVKIEITSDSVFKKYIDGGLDFTSTFNVKTGNMGYDTIFFHSPNAEYAHEEIKLLSRDTLHLVSPVLTSTATCNYFKRVK